MPPQRRLDGEMLAAMKTFSCEDEENQSTTSQRPTAVCGKRGTAGLLHSTAKSLNQSDHANEKALYRQYLQVFTGQKGRHEETGRRKGDGHPLRIACKASSGSRPVSALATNGSIPELHDDKSCLWTSCGNDFENCNNLEESITPLPDMPADTLQDPACSSNAVITRDRWSRQTFSETGFVGNSQEGGNQCNSREILFKDNPLAVIDSLKPCGFASPVLKSDSLIDRINHAHKRCSSLKTDISTVSLRCDVLLSELQIIRSQLTSGIGHLQLPFHSPFKTSCYLSQERKRTFLSRVPVKCQISSAYLQGVGLNILHEKLIFSKQLLQENHVPMTSIELSQNILGGVSEGLDAHPEVLKADTISVDSPKRSCNTPDTDNNVLHQTMGTGTFIMSSVMLLTPPCSDKSASSDQDRLQESKVSSADSEGGYSPVDKIPNKSPSSPHLDNVLLAIGAETCLHSFKKSGGPDTARKADQRFLGCSIIYETPSSSDHSEIQLCNQDIHLGIPGDSVESEADAASSSEESGCTSESSPASTVDKSEGCDKKQHSACKCFCASFPAMTHSNLKNGQKQVNCCELQSRADLNSTEKQENCHELNYMPGPNSRAEKQDNFCDRDYVTVPNLVNGGEKPDKFRNLESTALSIQNSKKHPKTKFMSSKGNTSFDMGTLKKLQPIEQQKERNGKSHIHWLGPTSGNVKFDSSDQCDGKTHTLANEPHSEFASGVTLDCGTEDNKDAPTESDKRHGYDFTRSSQSSPKDTTNVNASHSSVPLSAQTENCEDSVRGVNCLDITTMALKQADTLSSMILDTNQHYSHTNSKLMTPLSPASRSLAKADEGERLSLDPTEKRVQTHTKTTQISGESVAEMTHIVGDSETTADGCQFKVNSGKSEFSLSRDQSLTLAASLKLISDNQMLGSPAPLSGDLREKPVQEQQIFPQKRVREQRSFTPSQNMVVIPSPRQTQYTSHAETSLNSSCETGSGQKADQSYNTLERMSCGFNFLRNKEPTNHHFLSEVDFNIPLALAKRHCLIRIPCYQTASESADCVAMDDWWTIKSLASYTELLRCSSPCNGHSSAVNSDMRVTSTYQSALSTLSAERVVSEEHWFSGQENSVKTECNESVDQQKPWILSHVETDPKENNQNVQCQSWHGKRICGTSSPMFCDRKRNLSSVKIISPIWNEYNNSPQEVENVSESEDTVAITPEQEPFCRAIHSNFEEATTDTDSFKFCPVLKTSSSMLKINTAPQRSPSVPITQSKLSQLKQVRLPEACKTDVESHLDPCYKPTEHLDSAQTSVPAAQCCNMFTSTPLAPNDKAMRCTFFSHFPQIDQSCILDTSDNTHTTAQSAYSFLQSPARREGDGNDRAMAESGKHWDDQSVNQQSVLVGHESVEVESLTTANSKLRHATAHQKQPYLLTHTAEGTQRPVDSKLTHIASNQTYHVEHEKKTQKPVGRKLTGNAARKPICAMYGKNPVNQMAHISADNQPPSKNVFLKDSSSSANITEQVRAGFQRTYMVTSQSTQNEKVLAETENPLSVKEAVETETYLGGSRHQPAAQQFFKDAETGIELEGLKLDIGGQIYQLKHCHTDRMPVKERKSQCCVENQAQEVKLNAWDGHDEDTMHRKREGRNLVNEEEEEKPATKPLLPTPAYRRLSLPFFPPCAHCLHHAMFTDPGPCTCFSRLCGCAVDGDGCFERPHHWWSTPPRSCGFLNRPYNGPVTLCSLHGGSPAPFPASQPAEHARDSPHLPPVHPLSLFTREVGQKNRLAFVSLY